jgi:hypothetical protein
MKGRGLLILACLLSAFAASAAAADWRQDVALRDSLSRVHPRMRASWLKEHGLDDSYYTTFRRPDSQGLREVGRWSYGPSYDVDGRVTPTETLVALARGSGVSLIRFSRADSLQLELLADINAPGLLNRVRVRDTLLYVGSAAGLEIWNIADERNPTRLSWIQTALNDFDVQDSLVYVIGADDSFKIYNVSDPASPTFRGASRDSGYDISVCNGSAYVGDRWGLYVIDVSNPSSPHRIGSWGSAIEQVKARGALCYVTTFNPNQPGEITFHVLDVTTPANPQQVGSLDSAGGNDVQLVDTLAFCSGEYNFNKLTIVSVADSTRPRVVGAAGTPGWSMGIWASGLAQSAFVGCHWEGLQVFDTRNPAQPVPDTSLLGADMSVDICVDSGRAYVANARAGLKILDVSDPTKPSSLGSYDTAGQAPDMRSAAAKDSFAFVGWGRPALLALGVSDPTHPVAAGGCDDVTNPPEDMVLRDSFVYVAEQSFFQVVNVARPREPVRVGSCVLSGDARDVDLEDTVAYVGMGSGGLVCIDVANPNVPTVIGTWGGRTGGVDVNDTLAYVTGPYMGFACLSVANPAAPHVLDSLYLTDTLWWNDVVVVGSLAYVGGERVWVVDVSDPQNLRLVPGVSWTPPYEVRRLVYAPPHLYAACYEAGVCVLETVQVGVGEELSGARLVERPGTLYPNPVSRYAHVRAGPGLESAVMRDVLGRTMMTFKPGGAAFAVDLAGLRSGLYFIELRYSTCMRVEKLIKQ